MSGVDAPISIKDFEDAVHLWFSESTGLQTIWQNQSKPRPDYPFASLLITDGPIPTSPMWETRETYVSSQPSGEQIKTLVCVPCQFNVSCQVYVDQDSAINPDLSSKHYMTKALAGLALPSYLSRLAGSNISVVSRGSVQDLSVLIKTETQSRAGMDVVFGASLNAVEYNTWIEKVELKSNSLNVDTIVSL